jgi:hypothetical protein
MKRRFEMPVEPGRCNTFAIDDYLRSLQSPEKRKELIATVGYSSELREAYEKTHELPRGAVQLAMMAEDRRLKDLNKKLVKRFTDLQGKKQDPGEVRAVLMEFQSVGAGLQSLYPEAVHFLMQYSALAQRNKASFQGDWRFSSDYKILVAASNCPWWYPNVRIATNVNFLWNTTIAAYLWVAVAVFLAAVLAVAWAAAVYWGLFVWTVACLVVAVCPVFPT